MQAQACHETVSSAAQAGTALLQQAYAKPPAEKGLLQRTHAELAAKRETVAQHC